MKSIAVIGIGNLGLRHLESLYISKNKYKLYALDKYKSSLDNAHNHLNKVDNHQNNISYINSISQLPKKLDTSWGRSSYSSWISSKGNENTIKEQ